MYENNSELMFFETRGGFEQGFHNKRATKGIITPFS
jgi:hypothetical protein